MRNNLLFKVLDEKSVQLIIDSMHKMSCRNGQEVIKQGDSDNISQFFIVHQGECSVSIVLQADCLRKMVSPNMVISFLCF
jgi:hypothetical protein